MVDLDEVAGEAYEHLARKHAAREGALTASRESIRHAGNAIRAAHRREVGRARDLLERATEAVERARTACADEPEVAHAGFLADAEKELAEAACTIAVIAEEGLPGPSELGVAAATYLNGLAETVGELRRHLLDELRNGRLERCEALLATMDDIYAVLVEMDFPDGVTGGLRRSTDVARSILERTRGDLTSALVQDRLRQELEAHRRAVEAAGT